MTVKKCFQNPGEKEVRIWTGDVDEKSIQQLSNVAKLPFVFHHVAAMPDVHAGMGATIGSVIATQGAVIPSAVGVDIGCGMLAVKLNLKVDDTSPELLEQLMKAILARIPVGMSQHQNHHIPLEAIEPFTERLEVIKGKHPTILDSMKRMSWRAEMGTLGAGNHFIEISRDEEGWLWIMLHSGSRGPGNKIATYFIRIAKKEMKDKRIVLPDPSLAYFEEGTQSFDDYMEAVHWSQDYALANREEMLKSVLDAMRTIWPNVKTTSEVVNCHHNYVNRENHFGEDVWVTRKGATSAYKGEMGIIPGSMGTCSYIVSGLGEPDSFCSSSHGAGRRMSRTQAKNTFGVEDLVEQTSGVICRKDLGVIDEIPQAYKSIDEVMANQTDLVKPLVKLKQVLCIKG